MKDENLLENFIGAENIIIATIIFTAITTGFNQFLSTSNIDNIRKVFNPLEDNETIGNIKDLFEKKIKGNMLLKKHLPTSNLNKRIKNKQGEGNEQTANEILENIQQNINNINENPKSTIVGSLLQGLASGKNPKSQPTTLPYQKGGGNTNEPNDNIEQLFLLQLIFETDTITPDAEQNEIKVKKIFNLIYFAKVYYEFIVFIIINNNNDDDDDDEKRNTFNYYTRVLNQIEVKFQKILETETIKFEYKQSNKEETKKNYIKIIIAMMLFKLTDKENKFNELQFQYFLKLRGFDEIIDENTDKIIYDLNKETQIILEDTYKYNFLLPEETSIPDNYLPLIFSLIFNYNNDFLPNIPSNNINNNNSNTNPDTNVQNEPNTLYSIFSSSISNRVKSAINTGFEIVNDVVKSNYPKEYEKTVKIVSKMKEMGENYLSKKNEDEGFLKEFEDFIKKLIPCILNSYLKFANDLASNYDFKIAIMNNVNKSKQNNYEYIFDNNFNELSEKINYLSIDIKTLIPKFAEDSMKGALNSAEILVDGLIAIINELKNYQIQIDPDADVNKKLTDALDKIAIFIAYKYEEFYNKVFELIESYYNVYDKSLFNPKNRAINFGNLFTKKPFEIKKYFEFRQINTPYKFFENMTSAIFDDTTKFKKKIDEVTKINTTENEMINEEYFKKLLNEHQDDLQIKYDEIKKVSTFIDEKLINKAKLSSISDEIKKRFYDEKIKDEIITEIKKNRNIGKTLTFEKNTKLLKGISDKYLEKMRVIMFVFAKFPPEWIFDVNHIMNRYVFSVKYLLDEHKEVVIDKDDKKDYLKLMIQTLNKFFDNLPKDPSLLIIVYRILNSVYLLENYENNLELLLNVLLKSIKLDDTDSSNLLKLVSEMKKEEEKHNLGIKYLYYIVKVICLVNCYKELSAYKETPETTATATATPITTSAEKKIIDYIKTFEFNFVDDYYPNLTLKYEASIGDTTIKYDKGIYRIKNGKNEEMTEEKIEDLHNNFYQKIGSVIDENDVNVIKDYAKNNLYYDFLTFDKEHIFGNKNEKSYFYIPDEAFESPSPLLTSTETLDDMFQDIQTKIDENKIVFTLNPEKNGIVVSDGTDARIDTLPLIQTQLERLTEFNQKLNNLFDEIKSKIDENKIVFELNRGKNGIKIIIGDGSRRTEDGTRTREGRGRGRRGDVTGTGDGTETERGRERGRRGDGTERGRGDGRGDGTERGRGDGTERGRGDGTERGRGDGTERRRRRTERGTRPIP
jgi:hypothetical protein